ncbi:TM2 domain-containing protein Y66D12A.21-like [Symsagittifera roscoffensis]|uniref:TM2 domain-containing protein Y66D12A.21-like n=1 Tax=Symsagittifera roscoffensis TaxID=84072 RepID=UPI00307BA08C
MAYTNSDTVSVLIFSLFLGNFCSSSDEPVSSGKSLSIKPCDDLLPGQYQCQTFHLPPSKCNETYSISCVLAAGLLCRLSNSSNTAEKSAEDNSISTDKTNETELSQGLTVSAFNQTLNCPYNETSYRYDIALLLSVLCGVVGADRFYLGYPALGVLKLFSFGGLLIWWLVDIVLIALQILRPVDNSDYILSSSAPRMVKLQFDAASVIKFTHEEL